MRRHVRHVPDPEELIAMTAQPTAPDDDAVDLAAIQSILAGHIGPTRLPAVTVTEAHRPPRVFEFTDAASRDRFLLLLFDACELFHSGALRIA
jgi:hypothetical protein